MKKSNMHKLFKFIKWLGIIILGVAIIVASYLGITGVPAPFAISTKNIPRIPFSYIKEVNSVMGQKNDLIRFTDWHPTRQQMIVFKEVKGTNRMHTWDHHLNDPQPLPLLPVGVQKNLIFNPNPQKNYLIYSMDEKGNEIHQLYKFDLTSGNSTLLTNGKDRYLSAKFSPSGEYIVYISLKRNQRDYDVYLMDPDNPSTERLVRENEGIWMIDSWSPDSKKVMLRNYISSTENNLYILDIDTAELLPFTLNDAEKAIYNNPQWSKDGSRIFYTSDYQSEFIRLRVRNLETNMDSILIQEIKWDISSIQNSPDGHWLAVKVNEDGVKRLFIYNLVNDSLSTIDTLPFGNIELEKFHPTKNLLAFNLYRPSLNSDIYTYELEKNKLVKWTHSSENKDFKDPEIIHYPTYDIDSLTGGTRKITAFYHRPPDSFKRPHPVIIHIHGGPADQASFYRSPEWNVQLQKGYAYIVPNVRGSTGYGKTFADLDNGTLRENAVKDIGALLDWIAEQPELDANRIFVWGASYGGYMALACAVHYSDKILGAIDHCGISNFVRYLINTSAYRTDERRKEYGDERNPAMNAFLEKISPSNNIDKIAIPILIIQGENDARVPVSESRKMVSALESAVKEVWYMEASNEGHFFNKANNIGFKRGVEYMFMDDLISRND